MSFFHFPVKLSGAVLDNMIENVCLLLTSKTREVVKTALGFIKEILSAYENTTLASHLQELVSLPDFVRNFILRRNYVKKINLGLNF